MAAGSNRVVLYGVGSPVIVDVEETLFRLGVTLAAAVRNVPGTVRLIDQRAVLVPSDLPPSLRTLPFLVPIFTPAHRQTAVSEARAMGFTTAATIVDPTVIRPRSIDCAEGVYINAGCCLGAASRIEAFAFVNRGASLGHHAHVGPFVSIGPSAVVTGEVTLCRGAVIGAGAVLLPGIRVGDNAVVAAGAVVTHDVPERTLVVGNPGRVVRTNIAGYGHRAVS